MRIAPVALFCHNKSVDDLVQMVIDSVVTTHTHPQGVNGSILQALVVNAAVSCNPKEPLDTAHFVNILQEKMLQLETNEPDEYAFSFGFNSKCDIIYFIKIDSKLPPIQLRLVTSLR